MRLWLWVMLFVLALANAAHADADADAQKGYVEAQKLFDAGDYAGALPLFEKALSVTHSPNARLYVARCLAEVGRTVEAYEQMKETLDDAKTRAPGESKYVRTRDAAAAELVQLEAKVGRVVVALADDSADAEVTIAGAPLARERLGKPVAVEPGEVVVEANLAGRAPAKKSVSVAAGSLVTVALQLEPLGEGEKPPPQPTKEATKPEKEGGIGTVRAAGIAVLGLGVAGLVVMGVTGAMAQSRLDQL